MPTPRGEIIIDSGSVGVLRAELERALAHLRPSCRDGRDWEELALDGLLSRASVIVVGTRLAQGEPAAERIIGLRSAMPHVSLYVVSRATREMAPLLPDLAGIGVDEAFCLESASDLRLLVEAAGRRVEVPPPERALRALWAEWERNGERAVAMHCVRGATARRLDRELAWFGVSEKTLRLRLRRAGMPTPGLLARLGLVLHGCALGRAGSMEEVARRLGVGTAKELRALRQRVELRLREWPALLAILQRER